MNDWEFGPALVKLLFDPDLVPYQDYGDPLGGRPHGAFDRGFRHVVTTHGVESDRFHLPQYMLASLPDPAALH